MRRRFLSILARILPPAAMSSGWRGIGAVTDYISIINCLGKREASGFSSQETFSGPTVLVAGLIHGDYVLRGTDSLDVMAGGEDVAASFS